MRRLLLALAGLLFAASAHAAGTATNFDGVGTTVNDEITHFDTAGDALNAHAGNGIVVGNYYYWYGEDHSCGYRPGTVSPFCGIVVYRYDTTAWNQQPLRMGYVFNPSSFQTTCAPEANSFKGCYSPHMIQHPSNGTYVLWVYAQAASSAAELVFVCTTPGGIADGGSCVQQAAPTFDTANPLAPAFFTDSGTCYTAYTDLNSSPQYKVKIAALNAACTDVSGSSVDTGGLGEGLFAFSHGGTFFVGFGSLGCAYCTSTTVYYRTASTALGTYGSETSINATACNGQVRSVDVVTIGGITSYFYSTDQWQGAANQGLANVYLQPLTFTGAAIDSFPCDATVSIAGATAGSFAYPNGIAPDQTSLGTEVFRGYCDLQPTVYRLQTFVPATANTRTALPLGMNNQICIVAVDGCLAPDGTLTADIIAIDGSNNPTGSPIATATYTSASLSWSLTWKTITHAALTPGTKYGIRLSANNTRGCFSTAFNFTASNPYSAGLERYSTNTGTSWTTEANRALMFASYIPDTVAVVPFGGVAH